MIIHALNHNLALMVTEILELQMLLTIRIDRFMIPLADLELSHEDEQSDNDMPSETGDAHLKYF